MIQYATLAGAGAILAYLASTVNILLRVRNSEQAAQSQQPLFALIGVALLLHITSLYPMVISESGYDFSFFPVSSLIFFIICLIGWLTLLSRQPLNSLLLVLLPLAAITIAAALLFNSNYTPRTDLPAGVAAHVLLSIVSVGLFTIAALQALLMKLQMQQLKERHTTGIIEALPPLQSMELVLFNVLWAGFFCLSAGLILGGIYVEDLFAQHLAHKTAFSICAWFVFASVLWGRHRLGWRGRIAVNWTLVGLALLTAGFFGTKLVLELILQGP
ncbi:MAG: inner membrane protein YpjD [Pseudomonadales bacterium]